MRAKTFLISVFALIILSAGTVAPAMGQGRIQPVVVMEVNGVINPFSARYLDRVLDIAQRSDAALVVMILDTPGGLETSMRQMVQSILQSPVPVAVYISPEGARGASAGLFILMAGDIAAMSPATNVGAATPVPMGGEIDEAISEKILNDSAAFVRSLAERHGRNVSWVESSVRESLSMTSTEALEANVIDILANDLNDLLSQVNGREVRGKSLDLSSFTLQVEKMNWVERFYQIINEPNIAYMLLSLGILFLLAELSDPGLSVAGIGAGLCFIIGFMALGSLPVNWAAVGMLALSLILFVVALLTDTEVVVTAAGLIPFILGSLLLFTPFKPESPAAPELRVSLWLILLMAGIIVFFSLVILRAILKASKRPPQTGAESLIGKTAIAKTTLNPDGEVTIEHQTWSATSSSGEVKEGQPVKVMSVSGVRLVVTPEDIED
ncbi:MAG: nodulation protein NfeD [Chloroflexota bacterium]|nr:nodulation protein NfeD [Chloroflexota bacterium]